MTRSSPYDYFTHTMVVDDLKWYSDQLDEMVSKATMLKQRLKIEVSVLSNNLPNYNYPVLLLYYVLM